MNPPLLRTAGLSKTYLARGPKWTLTRIHAVDDVTLSIGPGECLGLVGESGSGKSTLGGMIAGIVTPDQGLVELDGQPLYKRRHFAQSNWKLVQYVFQDPYSSLNPRMRVGQIIAEPIQLWRGVRRDEALREAEQLLERVGLDPALRNSFPVKLSGGQRQRVSIARALAVRPKLIIFDEAVSALDVTIQAQILKLLQDLRRTSLVSFLFITHDIGVVRLVADRVSIMQGGRIVETCPVSELTTERVTHDYSRTLLSAVPKLGHPSLKAEI